MSITFTTEDVVLHIYILVCFLPKLINNLAGAISQLVMFKWLKYFVWVQSHFLKYL